MYVCVTEHTELASSSVTICLLNKLTQKLLMHSTVHRQRKIFIFRGALQPRICACTAMFSV